MGDGPPTVPDGAENVWLGESPITWRVAWIGTILILVGSAILYAWVPFGVHHDFYAVAVVGTAIILGIVPVTRLHERLHWGTLILLGYDPSITYNQPFGESFASIPSKWIPANHYHLSCLAPVGIVTAIGLVLVLVFPLLGRDVVAIVILSNAGMAGDDVYQVVMGYLRDVDQVNYTVEAGELGVWKARLE